MPRYYCDYCDTYLTHDSPSVRKQHNAGRKHKDNVKTYYLQFKEQVGAAFNPHLMGQRPHLPVPMMPMVPGIRPPIFLRPPSGASGYMPTMPPMMAPPGAPTLPGQLNSFLRPPSFAPHMSLPGNTAPPNSNAPAA